MNKGNKATYQLPKQKTGKTMPSRKNGKIRYLRKQTVENDIIEYPIEVKVASDELLKYWHEVVQIHYINTCRYPRADKGWNWPARKTSFYNISSYLGQDPLILSLGATINSKFIPFGMIMLAQSFPALQNHHVNSTHLLYMSKAPNSFIKKHTGYKFSDLGASLIDCAITNSYKRLHEGRIGLRAAYRGGQYLLNYYKNDIKLINLSPSQTKSFHSLYQNIIKTLYRMYYSSNVNPFFYADETLAFTLSQKYDRQRT